MPAANSTKAAEVPWCGHCNERTRLRQGNTKLPGGEFAEGPVRRCECHPFALKAAETSCGKHSFPPGALCELCQYGIGTFSHATCSVEANCYAGKDTVPMPHEPINLTTASIRQIARELAELRDPEVQRFARPYRNPRYEAALRDLALRQVGASRV